MQHVVAAGLLSLVVAAAGCGGGDATTSEEAGQPLIAEDFSFSPDELTVAAGTQVVIPVGNGGQVQHNITIEAFDVDTDLDLGGQTTVQFTTQEPGDFAFFCKFHPDQMVGQLTVE
jgi:plastocyanin